MFAAYISLSASSLVTQFVNELGDTSLGSNPKRSQELWSDYRVALIQQQVLSSKKAEIHFNVQQNLRLVSWSRIDNKEELKSQLDSDLRYESDEAYIIASYLKWGEDCCKYLVGDFTFLIYNEVSGNIFFARDQIGARPLYYYRDRNSLFIASSVAFFHRFSNWSRDVSQEWMARYVMDCSHDWEMTAYSDIKKVPPAHYLYYQSDKKKLIKQCYFEFCPEPSLFLDSDEEYIEAYKELLNQAVKCRTKGDLVEGSELSGGLDSSSITAVLAHNLYQPNRQLHTFGDSESVMAFECIYHMSRTVPMNMFHFITRKSVSTFSQSIELDCYGMPIDNSTASVMSLIFEQCQKLRVESLFSGFGGDEFVTSEAPVALVEFWNDKRFSLFLNRQRGNLITKPLHVLRWIYLFYKYNNNSITSRRLRASGELAWSLNPLNKEIVSKYDLKSRYISSLSYDANKNTQNEFALQDRWSPALISRMETGSQIAAHYGVEYKWPLLDLRLLKFFLSVPSSQKLGPQQVGRYLHRRAVKTFLPDKITNNTKDMIQASFFRKVYSALIKNNAYLFNSHRLAKKNERSKASFFNQIGKNEKVIEPTLYRDLDQRLQCILEQEKISFLVSKSNNHSSLEARMAQRQLSQISNVSKWLSRK